MSCTRTGPSVVLSGLFDTHSQLGRLGRTRVGRLDGDSVLHRFRGGAALAYMTALLVLLAGSFNALSAEPATAPADPASSLPAAASVPTNPAPSSAATAPPVSASLTTSNSPGVVLTNGMEALDDTYKLAIGDRLSLRIIEDEEDPVSLFVTDSGDVAIPYIGRYPAVGKTCQQLAVQLKTELEKDYFYHATVILAVDLKTRSRGKVYLVGAIRQPGPEDVPSDEQLTLSKAILRAGGFTENADKRKVKVTRPATSPDGEDETFVVDVGAVIEDGKMDSDVPLKPGDQIYVRERLFRF